jgi:hypothetical protein
MSLTVPYTFASQSGNVPASELDADFNAITSALNSGALPARAYTATSTLTYAATTTVDWSVSNCFTITLTGNVTLAFTNVVDGQTINIKFVQDGVGSRLWSNPSLVKWPGGTTIALSTPAASIDLLIVTYISGTFMANMLKAFA